MLSIILDYDGCGMKCDEILIEQEVIVAPCDMKIDSNCGSIPTCQETTCEEDQICIDEKTGP